MGGHWVRSARLDWAVVGFVPHTLLGCRGAWNRIARRKRNGLLASFRAEGAEPIGGHNTLVVKPFRNATCDEIGFVPLAGSRGRPSVLRGSVADGWDAKREQAEWGEAQPWSRLKRSGAGSSRGASGSETLPGFAGRRWSPTRNHSMARSSWITNDQASLAPEDRSTLFDAPGSAKMLPSFRADSLSSKGCHHAANQFPEGQSASTVPETTQGEPAPGPGCQARTAEARSRVVLIRGFRHRASVPPCDPSDSRLRYVQQCRPSQARMLDGPLKRFEDPTTDGWRWVAAMLPRPAANSLAIAEIRPDPDASGSPARRNKPGCPRRCSSPRRPRHRGDSRRRRPPKLPSPASRSRG